MKQVKQNCWKIVNIELKVRRKIQVFCLNPDENNNNADNKYK